MKKYMIVPTLACAAFAACGGGEPPQASEGGAPAAAAAAAPAAPTPPTGEMTMPDWFEVDSDARTVHMTITAGATADNNHWNFNGATNGSMAITVPEGYSVTVEFVNDDPVMAHSAGISTEKGTFGAMVDPVPVFAGAITENPASMIDSTMPGESESFEFVADIAGNYSMVCYTPGHAITGMWIYFNVSAEGQAGVQQ